MNSLVNTLNNLLVDVSNITGVPLRASAENDIDWFLYKAPLLEKLVLDEIELSEVVNDERSDGDWSPDQFINWWRAAEPAQDAILATTPEWLLPLMRQWLAKRDPNVLRELRTVLLFCYKACLPHSYESEVKAINTFVESNNSCRDWSCSFNRTGPTRVQYIARSLIRNVLEDCTWGSPPKHGPGQVYDKHVQKGNWSTWYSTIEQVYPYYEYFLPSKGLNNIQTTPNVIEDNIPARISLVPKDSRGPRLICIHPAEAIWIQQSARFSLETAISRPWHKRSHRFEGGLPHPCGKIAFDDQTVNQKLALKASSDKMNATLDLKEASDRIPNSLVEFLFDSEYRYIGCSRATKIFYKNKVLIEDYAGYAPMGNATTFPVESLVFWALSTAAIMESTEDAAIATAHSVVKAGGSFYDSLSKDKYLRKWNRLSSTSCYVFGDDIIVPSQFLDVVKNVLTMNNLIVNSQKTFSRGSFRESCGMDAYRGIQVSPLRWKLGSDIRSYEDMVSACNLAMRLRCSRYYNAATALYDEVGKALRIKVSEDRSWKKLNKAFSGSNSNLPVSNNTDHGGIAEYVSDACLWGEYSHCVLFHPTLHKFVTNIIRLEQPSKRVVGDWYHLISSLTSLERGGLSTGHHSTLSRRTRLSRGWSDVT